MKKSHPFDELSDRVCIEADCEKHIKQRLVDTKDAIRCYKHHCIKESGRAHYVNANPRKKRIIKGLPVKSFGGTATGA
jgi:hypothetical protein